MSDDLIGNTDPPRVRIEALLEALRSQSPKHARAIEDAYDEVLAQIRADVIEDRQWEVLLIEDLKEALERVR